MGRQAGREGVGGAEPFGVAAWDRFLEHGGGYGMVFSRPLQTGRTIYDAGMLPVQPLRPARRRRPPPLTAVSLGRRPAPVDTYGPPPRHTVGFIMISETSSRGQELGGRFSVVVGQSLPCTTLGLENVVQKGHRR